MKLPGISVVYNVYHTRQLRISSFFICKAEMKSNRNFLNSECNYLNLKVHFYISLFELKYNKCN